MPMRISQERLSAQEYIEFLTRTELGAQYPLERFEERIRRLVRSASLSLTARSAEGLLIGVCLGLTDFAYWLFITDLGVDRRYVRQGIGTKLMDEALRLAGGPADIAVYLCANTQAIPFYEKLGMRPAQDVMVRSAVDWTPFVVGAEPGGASEP